MKKYQKVNVYSFLLKDLLSFLNSEVFEHEETYSGLHNFVSNEAINLQENFNAAQLKAIKLQQKHNAKPKTLKERREKEQKNRHNKSQRNNKSAIALPKSTNSKSAIALPESTNSNAIIAEILAKEELELANAQFAKELRKNN